MGEPKIGLYTAIPYLLIIYRRFNIFNAYSYSTFLIGSPAYAVYLPGQPVPTPSYVHARDILRFWQNIIFE